jgi:hypothetical protein
MALTNPIVASRRPAVFAALTILVTPPLIARTHTPVFPHRQPRIELEVVVGERTGKTAGVAERKRSMKGCAT